MEPPSVLPNGKRWRTWLIDTGRGWGKTRTGAETIRKWVENGEARRIALIGRTVADVRDVMVEGPSGIMAISHPDFRPVYNPANRRVVWPNGAIATTFSADKPDQLRGPQHDTAWADEIAAWRYPDAWKMMDFGLRAGDWPRVVATTTPKPVPLIKDLLAHKDKSVYVTRGISYENYANLAPDYIEQVIAAYENTRLGRQEIYAQMLDDTPGALWTRGVLESSRRVADIPQMARIVVAVDPPGSAETGTCGIAVCGRGPGPIKTAHFFALDDLSKQASPHVWASTAVAAYHAWRADAIVAEKNFGGDMVESTIRTVDPTARVLMVTASRGKQVRAEPIVGLYEQDRAHHVGYLGDLEDELCTWVPGEKSPNRLDALVWGMTELMAMLAGRRSMQMGKPEVMGIRRDGGSGWRIGE